MDDLATQYLAEFQRVYPATSVQIRQRLDRDTRRMQYKVVIEGNAGDPLTEADMQEAIANFKR